MDGWGDEQVVDGMAGEWAAHTRACSFQARQEVDD